MRLENPWHEIVESILHPGEYPLFCGRLDYLVKFSRWSAAARSPHRLPWNRNERLTVVLLSYKRVRNMDPLVRTLLRLDAVGHVVVSNNNPEYRIEDWVRVRDDRLRLIDQPRTTPAGIRFELARSAPGDYFLSVDDDILMSPELAERLFQELIAAPEVPHGIMGEVYAPAEKAPLRYRGHGGWQVGLLGNREVDIINCVYAFTRQHVERMYQLAGALGMDVAGIRNGEDLLLSFSGSGRPRVHELGKWRMCLSGGREGVATWKTLKGFHKERSQLFEAVAAVSGARRPVEQPRLATGS